jgi:diacylglycerol kinase (ATP)
MTSNSHNSEDKARVVVAIVNTKSGERSSAQYILRGLREHLTPSCVFDIFGGNGNFDFQAIVGFVRNTAPEVLIVAGGDGTVSLAMDVCEAAGGGRPPYILVLPMGTGNDLSRTVGFGPGFSGPSCGGACCCAQEPLGSAVNKMLLAPRSSIDRWTVRFFEAPPQIANTTAASTEVLAEAGSSQPAPIAAGREIVFKRPISMINYFSIGFDAHIASQFANFRNENPRLCEHRVLNKVWYTCFGCGALCGEMMLDKVAITIDGVSVPTPPDLKSIVVSNVTSFAAGVTLWKDSKSKFKPPKINDMAVEVQGIYGANHMSLMQIGLRSAVKIGQGKHVVLRAPKAWCQFDGEPLDELSDLTQNSVVIIEISHRSVFPILSNA